MSAHLYDEKYYEKLVNAYKNKSRWAKNRIKNVLELVDPKQKDVTLDLGCGIGTFTIECSKVVQKSIGVDFSKDALLLAKKLSGSHGNSSKAEFVCAEAGHLPFIENSFDKLICADLVEHLVPSQYRLLLLEAHRVLKKFGTIAIYTPESDHIFEILRKNNIILRKDETHIDFKSLPYLRHTLKKAHFIPVKSYFKESHVLLFSIIERVLIRIPIISSLFRRRICISASKQ